MRRKLKNLKNKNGHSENGAPRQMIDEAMYREFRNNANIVFNSGGAASPHFDSRYSGWSNRSRPRDQAISLRPVAPIIEGDFRPPARPPVPVPVRPPIVGS